MKIIRLLVLILFVCLCCQANIQALELKVITENWPPISFLKDGTPEGMAVEVVEEILNRVRIPAHIQVIPWNVGWELATTNPNVVLFSMIYTEEREELFKMIGLVAIGETKLYARKGSGISIDSLEDAKHVKKIGTYQETYGEQFLKKHGFTNLDVSESPFEAAKKLVEGDIDLWINSNLTAETILNHAGYSFDDVEEVFTVSEDQFYISFSKDTPDGTVKMWRETLQAVKKDGTFARIYTKWLPGKTPPEQVYEYGIERK